MRDLIFELLHLLHLVGHLLALLFALVLQLLAPLDLPLPLHLFLLLLLHFHDPVVHFDQQVRELGVDFVYQVGEVGCCFVVDVFEEHHRLEVLGEVLHLAFRQLSLQDFDDVFFLRGLDLFGQIDDLLLRVDEGSHVPAYFADSQRIHVDNFSADGLDLDVGFVGDFVDEVSDGQLGALGKDVQNVLAFYET